MLEDRNFNFQIVGIGASAGGLDAFLQFISNLPVDLGLSYILIQHLEPSHPSLAVDIISRSTKLQIQEAANDTLVKPNHIYILPPNYNMEILNGRLNLSARNETTSLNLAIDFFFESLALYAKARAIGIILSGTGSDGTKGLVAIKLAGGKTFVQDPLSAKFKSMPEQAIASGSADLVLTPENMAKELIKLTKQPNLSKDQKISSDSKNTLSWLCSK